MSKGGGKEKSGEDHDEEIVSINVGGQVFVTTTTTLRNDTHSMLYAMFSGKYPSKKDFQGSYFIDRDGKFFRCIRIFSLGNYVIHDILKNMYINYIYILINIKRKIRVVILTRVCKHYIFICINNENCVII